MKSDKGIRYKENFSNLFSNLNNGQAKQISILIDFWKNRIGLEVIDKLIKMYTSAVE